MKTAVTLILVVLGFAGTATADFLNSNSAVAYGIEGYVGTDKAIYGVGENVQMLYSVTNLLNQDVTITGAKDPWCNLLVQQGGQTVWKKYHSFWLWVPKVDLSPGQSAGTSHNWNMNDDNGNPVGPGKYDVVGLWYGPGVYYDGAWAAYQDPPTFYRLRVPITIIPFIALTGNQKAVDSALQQMAANGGNTITTALQYLQTSDQVRNAYDQLSGQSRPPLAPVTAAGSARFTGTVSDRLHSIRSGTAYGFSGGPLLAMAGPDCTIGVTSAYDIDRYNHLFALGNGTDYYADQKWGFWGKGYGVYGDRETEGGTPGYQYTVYGTGFGFDYQFTDKLLFGFTGGHTRGDLDYSSSSSDSEIKGRNVGVYGGWRTRGGYFDSILSYADYEYETERYVGLTGETLLGKFDGYEISGYLEAGFNWHCDEDCLIQPLVSLQFSYLNLDSYTETGGASSLSYDDQSYESYKGSLGMKATKRLVSEPDGRYVDVQLRGRWIHEFGDAKSSVDAHFASDPGIIFTVSDEDISRDSAIFGAGLSVRVSKRTRLFVDYDTSFNADHAAHIISAGLEYRW